MNKPLTVIFTTALILTAISYSHYILSTNGNRKNCISCNK